MFPQIPRPSFPSLPLSSSSLHFVILRRAGLPFPSPPLVILFSPPLISVVAATEPSLFLIFSQADSQGKRWRNNDLRSCVDKHLEYRSDGDCVAKNNLLDFALKNCPQAMWER
ncbi:hypothetical protein Droror1_Dr00000613 [Drosera rotundifolia]